MAIAQWQSNDVLSTYDKTTGQVRTGYVNLQLPPKRELQGGFEFIGKELAKGFKVLSPTEALRIKFGLGGSDRMTSRTSVLKHEGIVGDYWDIVADRWKVPSVKSFGVRQAQIRLMSSMHLHTDTLTIAVQAIQRQAEQEVRDCVTIISRRLGNLCRQVIKDENGRMPLEMKRRYRTSQIGPQGIPESNPQMVINGITELNNNVVDPNVFSRFGDGTTADPVMDFITSAFCRLLVDPDSGSLNSTVFSNQALRIIAAEETAAFYPRLNTSTIPENYPKNKGLSTTTMNTLAAARKFAVSDIEVMRSFGTGEALNVLFKKASPMLKLAIVSAFYPWTHSSANPLGEYRSARIVSFKTIAANAERIVHAPHLVRTLFLMDMQNQRNTLMAHTKNYLKWIKGKCAKAAVRSTVPVFARATPTVQTAQSLLQRSTGASLRTGLTTSLARQTPLLRAETSLPAGTGSSLITGPILLPGFGPGSISTGVVGTETATTPADSAPTEVTTQELVTEPETTEPETTEPETTEPETTEPETTEAAEGSNKMIYIGSAIALTVAIGTVVYVKTRK